MDINEQDILDNLDDMESDAFNLEEVLQNVMPNVITPHLGKFASVKNEKKPRTLAEIMVDYKMSTLTSPTTKEVVHDGKIHKVRFFDITPLKRGVWCEMSLMLLQLTFNEQCQVIDALYPDDLKLTAKSFAVHFTNQQESPIQVVEDNQVHDKLDGISAGVAMLMAMIASTGAGKVSHPDIIKHYLQDMSDIVQVQREAERFKRASTNSDARFLYRDK